jgi:histidinol dehydrogenase
MSETLLRRVEPQLLAYPRAELDLPDVSEIVDAVRRDGEAALHAFAKRFGDEAPREVGANEIARAYETINPALRTALTNTAARVARFAELQKDALSPTRMRDNGFEMGHRIEPVARAGAYVPAGRYPLPSTLLMCAIPARIAGVQSIVVCSPRASAEVLAAAHVAGVDRFFVAGGAQAIAAMAYGTRLIPRVDLIVGPGNAYVAAAKRAVFGACGIDAIAGPSEVLVIASADAEAELVAADLLAQSEHDASARAMLLCDSSSLTDAVERELQQQLAGLATAETARTALRDNGSVSIVALEEAVALARQLAPEHLHLHGAAAEALADRTSNYGALFIGSGASEVFGDYGAGPNHVLPTNGTARFSSGLSVLTFLKIRTFLRCSDTPSESLIRDTGVLARAEGLAAHAQAAQARSYALK